jgi:phosphatidylglycerol:prolipoprotein diacylglycerol transferase
MISTFILWDISPIIIQIGAFAARWYGLLFALGFIIGQQIMIKIYTIEKRDQANLESLTIYMVLATIIGARLGHCLFYEPEVYLPDPIRILKVWEGGLASHGATVGIFVAIYLYVKKFKSEGYLWVLDRMVILIALAGCFIRLGNLMNSEIIGKQTNESWGFVFAQPTADDLVSKYPQYIDETSLHYVKQDTLIDNIKYAKINIEVALRAGLEADTVYKVKKNVIPNFISYYNFDEKNIVLISKEPQIKETKSGLVLNYRALGVPRHPTQIYEALSCLILFGLLILIYSRFKADLPEGLLLGTFMVVCFGLRFLYEYLKENQVAFEDNLSFNMGQILSIPLVIAGTILIIRSLRENKIKE